MATPTTAGSAEGSPRSAGRARARRRSPRSPAAIPDGAVVLLDGLIASPAPTCSSRRRAGCGRSCSCTCRSATRASTRCSRPRPRPSSRPATGRRRRLGEVYGLPAEQVHVAEPGVDPPTRAGKRGRRRAAVRRGGDARQGPRRAARRARDGDGAVVAVRVRGQPGSATRRGPSGARATTGSATGCDFTGPRTGPGARPRVRRRGPARARLARRDVRHGRHRGPGARRAGPRRRGRRGDRGARARGGRHRPGLLVPPGDPAALGAALRAWLGDAELRERLRRAARERRASLRAWPATASDVAGVLAGARDAMSGAMSASGSARSGSTCASRPTRRRARPSSPSASRGTSPPAALVIHDLGGGSGAMGRWLAPRLPGPQHWVVHDRDADLLELAVAQPAGRAPPSRRGGPTSRG